MYVKGHSRSLKMERLDRSVAVCEIFSAKELRDLETQVRSRSRSLKMARFDRPYATFYWPAIVNITVSYIPFAKYNELLGVECRCCRQKSQFCTNIWLLDRWLVEWNFSVDVRLPHISDSRRILATWLSRANISAQFWQDVKLPQAHFVVVVCFWQSLLTIPVSSVLGK